MNRRLIIAHQLETNEYLFMLFSLPNMFQQNYVFQVQLRKELKKMLVLPANFIRVIISLSTVYNMLSTHPNVLF